jgi:hypothetical protein
MDVDRREDDTARSRVHEALDVAATDAARRAARKTARRVVGGYFLLLLSLLVGATFFQRNTNAGLHRTNMRLERAETRACERLQVQRERANVSEARDYLLMVAIAQAPRASRVVREEYAGLARTAKYDPPTDCVAAVSDPAGYVRPASLPFCSDARGLVCRRGVFPDAFARRLVRAAQERQPQPAVPK